jgi:Rad3-related DNA helicase
MLLRDRQKVGMLIADECHDLLDALSLFLGTEFSRHECLSMRLDWPDAGLTVDDWRQWAGEWLTQVDARVAAAELKIKSSQGKSWSKELKRLRDLKRKLERLNGMQEADQWILNEQDRQGQSMSGVRFDPLSPARYAEDVLWRGIERIVLVSATVRPKTCELLGIQSSELEFCEYDSSFDPKRRPTIYIPTGVRMTYKTEQDDVAMRWWLNKFDGVIGPRLHQKGIVHCVSYRRSAFIHDNSEYREHMLVHNSHDRARVIAEFRRREAPAILLSPAVDTGYDFPASEARWQCIVKIPFASVQDKLIKARQEKDKEYGLFLAAQTLVQMAGRIVRSETDYGQTFVLDEQFSWFYWRVRRYLPGWFQEAVIWADGVPEPIDFDEPCPHCGEIHVEEGCR